MNVLRKFTLRINAHHNNYRLFIKRLFLKLGDYISIIIRTPILKKSLASGINNNKWRSPLVPSVVVYVETG